MNIFTRMSNGWNIASNSWAVLMENRRLILFPILSAIALILVILSFVLVALASVGWDIDGLRDIREQSTAVNYLFVFIYYLINYFIIVFFNTALIHCTHLYFNGEQPTIRKGLRFSLSRIGVLLSWAAFAATVGTILRILQDNLGSIGKFVTGLIGIVWSVATFFVVPVIAYENLGPLAAFKRSTSLMREKWGESLGAGFSFGLIQLLGILLSAAVGGLLGWAIHPLVGIAVFVLGVFAVMVLVSAVRTIFISAVYHNLNGDPVKHFNQQFADQLFVQK
ncbi:DUF6159 family protein [Puia sp.]|jgi:hypothetical protein|uniref:DUF6159 family protein n=1 Tax=Puia sp. TaxID=2045100 RepID=UPI002F40C930